VLPFNDHGSDRYNGLRNTFGSSKRGGSPQLRRAEHRMAPRECMKRIRKEYYDLRHHLGRLLARRSIQSA
jgi:hypothetical protein